MISATIDRPKSSAAHSKSPAAIVGKSAARRR
jgi:hypothetical protein